MVTLGAVKTTPIAALQVETSEMPLFLRRQKLAMAYWINLQGQRDNHPVREVLNDCWEILNATGKGFAWKIKGWVNEDGLDSKSLAPIVVISPIPDTGRTGTAFCVPEFKVRKAGRITDGTSIYTAEMTEILMALEWVMKLDLIK